MFYANTFTLKMENKKMATKALEVMKEALAQVNADGFKYDSRETVEDFANDLMVKGSAVIAPGNCGLMPDANHIAIPEMFKSVARCFCFDKFTTKVFFDSDYEWESFDIIYEDGELIINSLYHDHDAEPYCEDCDDYYRIIEEDGMITVEMHQECMKAALEECMKECGVSRYEAAYIMAFDFYECAGFDTEVLEKELKSMSEETLIHHVLTEM